MEDHKDAHSYCNSFCALLAPFFHLQYHCIQGRFIEKASMQSIYNLSRSDMDGI